MVVGYRSHSSSNTGVRGQRDSVAGPGLGQAPAVEHDQRRSLAPAALSGPGASAIYSAAATIAANDSASRLAPPTSAPSMSGSASSSAALSGLTLPP